MGSPDLPNEENNICRPPESSLPMHGGNTTASDDSDIENIEYLGYEPLAFDEDTMEYTSQQNNHDNDEDDANDNFDYQVSEMFRCNMIQTNIIVRVLFC